MDVGLPGDGDTSINALCCQINSSFTKPSDELFGEPPLPASAVPPVLPPPPAPLQGNDHINSLLTFSSVHVYTGSPRPLCGYWLFTQAGLGLQ